MEEQFLPNQTGAAISLAGSQDENQSRLRMLYEIAAQPTARFEDQLRESLGRMTSLLGLDYGLLSEIQGDTLTIVAAYVRPGTARVFIPGTSRPLKKTYCAETVASDGPLAIDNAGTSVYKNHDCYGDTGLESYIGIPVRIGGEVYGTLSFVGTAPKSPPFTPDDTDLLSLLARWVGVLLERRRAEAQVEQSERLLAGVLLGSLDGIIALEAIRGAGGRIEDFVFLLVNPTAAETFGQRAENLIGTRYLDRVPGAREAGVFDALVRVVETGEPYRDEILYQADEIHGWYDYSAVPLDDGIALRFRDITPRKERETALAESEQRFRDLFESSPDAIFVESFDGVVLDANPAAVRLHRADLDWLLGRSVLDLVPEDYRDSVMSDFGRFSSGETGLLESYSLARDGTVIPVEVRTGRITYGGEEALLLQVRDITERQAAVRALRESEQRFAKAFHAAPVAVTISTLHEGRYVDVNDSFCALTGYGRLEIAGRTEADLGLMAEAGAQPPGLDALEAGKRVREAEFQIRRKDGEVRDVLVSAEPLDLGGVACILGIGIDVTDRKRLEREVIEVAEMERRRIGQDLHDELGQQLTGAAFLGETLRQKLAAQGSEGAEEASQLTTLINDALAETRDIAQLLSPVDVQAEGLMDALQKLADQTERVFDLSCLLETEGDVRVSNNAAATHLYRIAQEAVNNAIKHATPSEVVIALSREQDGLRLVIRDDGDGLDPETFQRPSGLGLRTMQYRAALIGATISLDSKPGRTRLTIHLPPQSEHPVD